jgi:tetratricopeptide (TPR) repeat protein
VAAREVPTEALNLYSRALLYEDRGDRTRAIELYEKALDKFPDFTEAKEGLRKARGS